MSTMVVTRENEFIDEDAEAVVMDDGSVVKMADVETGAVRYVLFKNGRRSYGKAWYVWDGTVHRIVRVGAGAYGDYTVLRRDYRRAG